ncbi:MAG: hypothetical protein AAF789_08915 [Bacteroidota bacterium]
MRRGKFEEEFSSKFEGEGVEVPSRVWSAVENELNADLSLYYERKQTTYKWVAAAAITIALTSLMLAFGSLLERAESGGKELGYYNALKNPYEISSPLFAGNMQIRRPLYTYVPIQRYARPTVGNSFASAVAGTEKQKSVVASDLAIQQDLESWERLEGQTTAFLPMDEVEFGDQEIQRLSIYSPGYSKNSIAQSSTPNKFWIGAQAGAGAVGESNSNAGTISNEVGSQTASGIIEANSLLNPSPEVNTSVNDGVARSLQLDFGMQLSKRWTLESGLAYTNIARDGTSNVEFIGFSSLPDVDDNVSTAEKPTRSNARFASEIQSSYNYDIQLTNNVQIASLPVQAGYLLLDKKVSLKLNAGLMVNYLVQNRISNTDETLLTSSSISNNRDWSLNGVSGLELGYTLTRHVDFTLQPNYRHPLGSVTEMNTAGVFVQTGFRYNIN